MVGMEVSRVLFCQGAQNANTLVRISSGTLQYIISHGHFVSTVIQSIGVIFFIFIGSDK